jgi:hypothetical protein
MPVRQKMSGLITLLGIIVMVTASSSGQWAASGNNISNTNSGDIGLGTASPAAKAHVVPGTSSTVGLIVQGDTNLSSHIQEWQNSSGTVLGYIDKSGNLKIGQGVLGFTLSPTTYANHGAQFDTHVFSSGVNLGVHTGLIRVSPTEPLACIAMD